MAIGTGSAAEDTTISALATELTDSGLERASATVNTASSATSGDTATFVYTWTATASKNVKECGVFNSSTGGACLCYGTFTSAIPMESDDTLKVNMLPAKVVIFWMKVVNSVKAVYRDIYANTEPSMRNFLKACVETNGQPTLRVNGVMI